ncbi:MAG: hypothetical protein FJX35_13215 [Alphaproteobacteria bacterium]|nr:hypothetical protein [Alphaproteobacteria bacterium]
MAESSTLRMRSPSRLLEPGGRFPNFALPRIGAAGQSGAIFEFYRDITKGHSVILLGRPDPIWRRHDLAFQDLGANLIAVVAAPEAAIESSSGMVHVRDAESRLRLGLLDGGGPPGEPTVVVLDANQRIIAHRCGGDQSVLVAWAIAQLQTIGRQGVTVVRAQAPVLLIERVMTPEFCRRLTDVWAADHVEGKVSAVVDGKPASLLHDNMKRRLDHTVRRPSQLYDDITNEIARKVAPEVFKAFQFEKFRAGEYYIACYDAGRADFFAAHRDNTTPQTAKRRFALTVNLNDDYDGGELAFPEFGPHGYRTAAGGGIVFSCSLLHEARPVTRGRRYALLAFLIDPA